MMLKRFFTVVLAVATTVSVVADGYEVSYEASSASEGVERKGSYQIAVLKKNANGTMSLAEAIKTVNNHAPQTWEGPVYMVRVVGDIAGEEAALSAIEKEKVDLSMATGMTDFSVFAENNAVKYLILPSNTSKTDVNIAGKTVDAAVSAVMEFAYVDGWQYVCPNTGETIETASLPTMEAEGVTYVNLSGTGVYKTQPTAVASVYCKADGSEYVVSDKTPVLYKNGVTYGLNAGVTPVALTVDTYYIYNGGNRYNGELFRKENGVIYGNTGKSIKLSSIVNAFTYNKENVTYVYTEEEKYEGKDGKYGLVGNKANVVELTKNTEYRTYGVNGAVADINNYTIIGGPKTEWGNTYYETKEGVALFVVDTYTYANGQEKYESDVYTLNNKYYGYTTENPFALLSATANGETVYYADDTKQLYDGELYDNNQGLLIGGDGKDVALSEIVNYYIDNSAYVGPITNDNKGVAEWGSECFEITPGYIYSYSDLAGREKTRMSETELSEIDMTNSYDDLWIMADACSVRSESPESVALTAYLSVAGTLRSALARWELLDNTNNSANNGWTYNTSAVTSLTLSGNIKASDIANGNDYLTDEGNAFVWDNGYMTLPEGKTQTSADIAAMTASNITYIDLKDAVFAVQTDMNFNLLNQADHLKTVILPQNEKMTLIPAGAFCNQHEVAELCIPYNYETIGAEAFCNTHALMHIYTTDQTKAVIIDNGKYTYTFSANLKEIQSLGTGKNATFFGEDVEKITDVYVLAENAPKCGAGAFATSMTHCNGGFAGNWAHPIRRENYQNQDGRMMCILRYPTGCAVEEEKNYTDVTRVYTLADETGATDGKGSPILWPRHNEFLRSYNQAVSGVTWDAWQAYETDGSWAEEVIASLDVAQKYTIDASKTYNQADYQGWHEFVLAATINTKQIEPQKEHKKYVQRDWLTVCVPYDLKKSQVLEILGVDCSADAKTVKKLDGTEETVNESLYPDVRTLTQVSRSVNNGRMTLHISNTLANDENGCSWNVALLDDAQGFTYEQLEGDDPVVMRGGHPYLIRAYVPAEWDSKITNIGMYIMAVAESANRQAAIADSETEKPYQFNKESIVRNVMLPCLKHDIQALNADAPAIHSLYEDAEQKDARYVYKDQGRTAPAMYHFIGTYTESKIPQYAYYIGKAKDGTHKFSRTTKTTFTWKPYSAVIVGLSSPEYKGFNDAETSSSIKNISIVANNANDLVILAGETTNQALAGKALTINMDDRNDGSTATEIEIVETDTIENADENTYTLSGQRVSSSPDALRKGIYIVNGQKRIMR